MLPHPREIADEDADGLRLAAAATSRKIQSHLHYACLGSEGRSNSIVGALQIRADGGHCSDAHDRNERGDQSNSMALGPDSSSKKRMTRSFMFQFLS